MDLGNPVLNLRSAAALGLLGLDRAAGRVGEAVERLLHGVAAADEEARHHLRVALPAGLLELAPGVGAQHLPPRHPAVVGPREEPRRTEDVPVQAQRLPPGARQPPPGLGLRRVVVEDRRRLLDEVPVQELLDGVGPLVDGPRGRPRPRRGEGAQRGGGAGAGASGYGHAPVLCCGTAAESESDLGLASPGSSRWGIRLDWAGLDQCGSGRW